ncbi:MAG: chemotaxis protein CheW [Bacillota bacterium]
MLDMFIFETNQMLEQLEQIIINTEKSSSFEQNTVNEIFRIMHTIKGSSGMMLCNDISMLAHAVEDVFGFLREKPVSIDCSWLCDLILESIDFIKGEIQKINNGGNPDGTASPLIEKIKEFLMALKEADYAACNAKGDNKRCFKANVYFEEECGMENIRAYTIIQGLKEIAEEIEYYPSDIIDNDDSAKTIRKEGFQVRFRTNRSFEEMHNFFSRTICLKDLELAEQDNPHKNEDSGQCLQGFNINAGPEEKSAEKIDRHAAFRQSMISVSIAKLDKLMDMVGELVISEAMLTQNPDLKGLALDNFQKAARQHHKIINELQDVAMSIRMVPLAPTFQKMNRIVRDMCKKLKKEVQLKVIGEETEVDKNIIEHISDPLMHLLRNSIDHGIESVEERLSKGKPGFGSITLEAKNAGGDVLIIVKDDGRGLDKEKILARARESGLVNKPESELTDKEIYSYIFVPGFSTKNDITEFSGRGVGMDVVYKNISTIGGTVLVDSVSGKGSTFTIKIPLTLAIMDGMIVKVGGSTYTVPITSIRESFKVKKGDVITDLDGNELIMVRGKCYSVLRLHEIYKVDTNVTNISDGIVIMTENDGEVLCIFVDELVGEQQVVVKALPEYITNIKKVRGLAGCTLLGDGSISLILDIAGLFEKG